jgi:hypothetical protein
MRAIVTIDIEKPGFVHHVYECKKVPEYSELRDREIGRLSWRPSKRVIVGYWQILSQKSAATDRAVMPFVKGGGFDPPALTPSTQLQRYATHRA